MVFGDVLLTLLSFVPARLLSGCFYWSYIILVCLISFDCCVHSESYYTLAWNGPTYRPVRCFNAFFFFFFTFVPEGWNLRRWEYHCHANLDFTGFTCVIGVKSSSAGPCLFVVTAAVLDFSFRMFFLSFSSALYLCKTASALIVCSFSVWLADTIGLMQLWIKQTWVDL